MMGDPRVLSHSISVSIPDCEATERFNACQAQVWKLRHVTIESYTFYLRSDVLNLLSTSPSPGSSGGGRVRGGENEDTSSEEQEDDDDDDDGDHRHHDKLRGQVERERERERKCGNLSLSHSLMLSRLK